jgi:hypothetical protein
MVNSGLNQENFIESASFPASFTFARLDLA